jgi:hypothetical protein
VLIVFEESFKFIEVRLDILSNLDLPCLGMICSLICIQLGIKLHLHFEKESQRTFFEESPFIYVLGILHPIHPLLTVVFGGILHPSKFSSTFHHQIFVLGLPHNHNFGIHIFGFPWRKKTCCCCLYQQHPHR